MSLRFRQLRLARTEQRRRRLTVLEEECIAGAQPRLHAATLLHNPRLGLGTLPGALPSWLPLVRTARHPRLPEPRAEAVGQIKHNLDLDAGHRARPNHAGHFGDVPFCAQRHRVRLMRQAAEKAAAPTCASRAAPRPAALREPLAGRRVPRHPPLRSGRQRRRPYLPGTSQGGARGTGRCAAAGAAPCCDHTLG